MRDAQAREETAWLSGGKRKPAPLRVAIVPASRTLSPVPLETGQTTMEQAELTCRLDYPWFFQNNDLSLWQEHLSPTLQTILARSGC